MFVNFYSPFKKLVFQFIKIIAFLFSILWIYVHLFIISFLQLFVYILSCSFFSGISNWKLSSFIFILSFFLISVFKTFYCQSYIGSIPKFLLYKIFGIDPTVTERVIFQCHMNFSVFINFSHYFVPFCIVYFEVLLLYT